VNADLKVEQAMEIVLLDLVSVAHLRSVHAVLQLREIARTLRIHLTQPLIQQLDHVPTLLRPLIQKFANCDWILTTCPSPTDLRQVYVLIHLP